MSIFRTCYRRSSPGYLSTLITRNTGQTEAHMAYYRIYWLDAADRIFGVQEAHCESDQIAIEVGRPLLTTWPAVEIWERARQVARLLPEHAKAALYAVL